jgi:nodulation protein E
MRRVAITGTGVISACGNDVEHFWDAMSQGRSGIAPIVGVNTETLRFKNGAQVKGFEPAAHFPGSQLDLLDRFAQFALVAARQAIASSGVEFTPELKRRTAVITGTSAGGQGSQDAGFVDLYKNGRDRMHPFSIARTMSNAGASHITMEFGLTGPAFTTSTACSSSNHAIGQAFAMVRSGQCDLAITGGSEAPFNYGFLKGWEAMRVVAQDTCRPFCKQRSGLILGEGAGMFVLEPLEHARARGANILGEIVGFGMSSDANHITAPSAEGAAAAMGGAIEDADLSAEAIGYINAHGTGTAANDPTETRAVHLAFGDHAKRLIISSTKSMHGHALGGAGAIEAVATVLALKHSVLPPTANFIDADAECDLEYVPNNARKGLVEYALSNSFAFGGLNAVLAFRAL